MSFSGGSRIPNSTLSKFIRGQIDNVIQRDKFLSLVKQRGLISYNNSGKDFDWLIKYKRGKLANRPDGAQAEFDRPDRRFSAKLEYGKLEMFEPVTKGEKLQNRGAPRRINLIEDTIKSMTMDLTDYFLIETFGDGNDPGKLDPVYGLTSILGKGSAGSDYVTPSAPDTYAGKSMALGALGGAVKSGAWPTGQFDPEYYAWTPLQADYTDSGWSGTTDDWPNNCLEVVRRLIDMQQKLRGKRGVIDVFLLDPLLYSQFKDALDPRQRYDVPVGAKYGLASLGFKDHVNFDGVEVTPEPLVPEGMAIGIAFEGMELRSMQGQIFDTEDDYLLSNKSQQFSVDFWGQWQFNPWQMVCAYDFPA